MASTCMKYRELRRKYPNQIRHRCSRCGRPRGYIRRFGLCRICFREFRAGRENPRRYEVVVVAWWR